MLLGDSYLGGRTRNSPFQLAEQWVLLVKKSTVITVCWALSFMEISVKKRRGKKQFSLRHTFPPVLHMEKYQPHGANS